MQFRLSTMLLLTAIVCVGIGWIIDRTSRNEMIEVTLRGDGSEYRSGNVYVVLRGNDVLLNGKPHIKTHGSIISFRYPVDRSVGIKFLLHQE